MTTPALANPTTYWEDNTRPVKVFFGLFGPASGGKTYSAMELATILSNDQPFVVIDTEDRSANLFIDDFPNARILNLTKYSQRDYKDAIDEAIRVIDPAYIVMDSLSDEWAGVGGVLAQHAAEEKKGKDSFSAWNDPKTVHTAFIKWLRGCKPGIIATMRAKDKIDIKKKGEAPKIVPIQDGTIMNQFDLGGYVANQGTITITKSRLNHYIDVGSVFKRGLSADGTRLSDLLVAWKDHKNGIGG